MFRFCSQSDLWRGQLIPLIGKHETEHDMESIAEYRNAGRKFFPQVIYEQICEQVAKGKSISQICEDPSMPSKTTVYSEIASNPILSKKFADATRTAVERRAATGSTP
jgi:hypothetical protein